MVGDDGDLLVRLGRSLCNIGHGRHSFRLGCCHCAICLVVGGDSVVEGC
jgi:hypothetical protein